MRKYAGIILYIVFLHFTYSQGILNTNKKNYENKYKLVEQLLKKDRENWKIYINREIL